MFRRLMVAQTCQLFLLWTPTVPTPSLFKPKHPIPDAPLGSDLWLKRG
jgi:hypothetical protein